MKIKNLFVFILLFFSCISYAQDTTYCDVKGTSVYSIENAFYYRVISYDTLSIPNIMTIREYLVNNILISEKHKVKLDKSRLSLTKPMFEMDGKSREWYDNGKIHREIDYKYGKMDGTLTSYWDNGQIKRQDSYKKGEFIKGLCFNNEGKKIKYFPYEVLTEFPGGLYAYTRFTLKNLIYPVILKNQQLEGTVHISVMITKEGKMKNEKILHKANEKEEFNNEALRFLNSMPDWKPSLLDGEPVDKEVCIRVDFKMGY